MPMTRLLGIGAAAALLALCWMAAGASAQTEPEPEPSVAVAYGGWALMAGQQEVRDAITNSGPYAIEAVAPGSNTVGTALGAWQCTNFRCHYLSVSWEGIDPDPDTTKAFSYTITLTREARDEADFPHDIGMTADDFAGSIVATEMTLGVPSTNTDNQQYVAVPWPGERLTVRVSGAAGSEASAVFTRAGRTAGMPDAPAAVTDKTRANENVGSTLVQVPESALPMVMTVWPKLDGVTHYEVQYIFRTRDSDHRKTTVTRYVAASQIHAGSATTFDQFTPQWGQHPNADRLSGLNNDSFGNDGEWIAVVTTLPKLLAGAEGWPEAGADFDTEMDTALGEGQNAVGVRVRPLLACGVYDDNALCATDAEKTGALALAGRKSIVSYVRFIGNELDDWVSSAGTAP